MPLPSLRLLLVLFGCLSLSSLLRSEVVIKEGDVLDICGDAMTQFAGYPIYIEDYLLVCHPIHGVKTINCGFLGGTYANFVQRMKNDALTFSPTVVTAEFGYCDGKYDKVDPTNEKNYRESMTTAIKNLKASGVRSILVASPGVVDPGYFRNPWHPEISADTYNQTLGRLSEIAKEVAQSEGVIFVDVHPLMLSVMTQAKAALGDKYPMPWEVDGQHDHIGANAHLVMAYAFLKAMGFDGDIGTITFDATSAQGEATEGHRVVSSKPGEITIESSKYPFCFRHDDSAFRSMTEILSYLPFNADLNRFKLVVKNLKSPRAKITWGKGSKEFSKEDLEKGINLAAEFLDNPFVQPFMVVDAMVKKQLDFQVLYIKDYLGGYATTLPPLLPGKQEAFKSIDAGYRDVNEGLMENCGKLLKPVTHAIQIEEVNK